MNIPALNTKFQNLPASAFHLDVEPMSRVDEHYSPTHAERVSSNRDRHSPIDATTSTLSYPQRIAVLIARAPSPPPLRRLPPAARAPMSEETRAMLLMVHTAQATFGGAYSTQTH